MLNAVETAGPQSQARQVLGLSDDCTQEQVKAAYRERAKQWHPDLMRHSVPGEQVLATEQMAQIKLQPVPQTIGLCRVPRNSRFRMAGMGGGSSVSPFSGSRFRITLQSRIDDRLGREQTGGLFYMYPVVHRSNLRTFVLSLGRLKQALSTINTESRSWWVPTVVSSFENPRVVVGQREEDSADRINDIAFSLPIIRPFPRSGLADDLLVELDPETLDPVLVGLYRVDDRLVEGCLDDFCSFWDPLAALLDEFCLEHSLDSENRAEARDEGLNPSQPE